jgi:hypothetical protein
MTERSAAFCEGAEQVAPAPSISALRASTQDDSHFSATNQHGGKEDGNK